jgi:hypothetical protein
MHDTTRTFDLTIHHPEMHVGRINTTNIKQESSKNQQQVFLSHWTNEVKLVVNELNMIECIWI